MEETITTTPTVKKVKTVDLERLREVFHAALAEQGIVLTGTVTHEQLMERQLANGVDPKKNLASRDIIRARYCGED